MSMGPMALKMINNLCGSDPIKWGRGDNSIRKGIKNEN